MKKFVLLLSLFISLSVIHSETTIFIAPYHSFYNESGEYNDWSEESLDYTTTLYSGGISIDGFFSFSDSIPLQAMVNLNLGIPYRILTEVNDFKRSTTLNYPDQNGFDLSGILGGGFKFSFENMEIFTGIGISGNFLLLNLSDFSKGRVSTLGIGGVFHGVVPITSMLGISFGVAASYNPLYLSGDSLIEFYNVDNYGLFYWTPSLGVNIYI